MNISQENRFNLAPTVDTPRSKFLMHQNIRTTFNAGLLIPLSVDTDIMPGDTFKIHGTIVCRQSTSIHPVMDNCFLEVFGVFVPHRLSWEHWKEFWGENTTGSWVQTTQYSIPKIVIAKSGAAAPVQKGDTLQYMGIPILGNSTNGIKINALAWRAYAITWNELFRDENVAAPIYVYKGDSDKLTSAASNNTWGSYDAVTQYIPTQCAPVYKYKDYYNACLPDVQKGNPITLPLGNYAPIKTDGNAMKFASDANGSDEFTLKKTEDPQDTTKNHILGNTIGDINPIYFKSGLQADLSNAVAATINAQRFAFAAQRILEAKARVGSRYWEILEGLFHVSNPSAARLQRPELLFHRKLPINMTQVPQTSSTDNTSAQGNVAAYSLTVDSTHYTTHSFTEHGTLLILCCVRQEHSYDTGIAKQWLRDEELDFYHSQLAFLGEQPVKNIELYATGTSTDEQVFGYNERWAELRYKPNINTGAFSTQYAQTLASWHYGDAYTSLPVLSDNWRRETKDFIDRTLAVPSTTEDQFILDSRWNYEAIRPIPMFSIPSLIDHF